jgi:CcmD family protein
MNIILLQGITPPSNLMYLFAAFTIAWAGVFVYAALLSRRQRDIKRDISHLSKSVHNLGLQEDVS